MALTTEWRRRIENFIKTLGALIFNPIQRVDFQGFTTLESLSYEQALNGTYQPMPAGKPWGAKWEYGWFKAQVVLPGEVLGKRVVVRCNFSGGDSTGVESLVWVNGRLSGAINRVHPDITLCRQGVPGDKYEILAEAYAGHGIITVGGGPVPFGVETVPEAPPTQRVMGESYLGVIEDEIFHLYLDCTTLLELRDQLDSRSLRVAEIDQGLMDVTCIADLELSCESLLREIRIARERLKPLLDCVNGTTMPTMYAFGHAHLDVAWLWPLQETERKIARTIANQLSLMDEYPEYRYLQSQAVLLRMLQQKYPDLYGRVKERVKSGQIMLEGGTWVEPDTNLTGGESLIRQFLYGRKFFKDEFGANCELFWEPDAFGYSGALPQILRGCGIKYFSTAKLNWLYNGGEPFPYNFFVWEGIDGSEVIAYLFHGYSNETSPMYVINNWNNRLQLMNIFGQFFVFGEGDGGGGPTRSNLEYLKRERDLEGVPRIFMTSPLQLFKDIEKRGPVKNRYVGELYYACHRGTYTSQARTKRYNRKCEVQLREAEFWGVIGQAFQKLSFQREELHQAWQAVLLNQFHDILPGSSISRVYEEAEKSYRDVLDITQQIIKSELNNFVESGESISIFNSLSWPRTVLIALPEEYSGAVTITGEILPIQIDRNKNLVEVKLPACGWTTVKLLKIQTGDLVFSRGIKTIPVGSDRFVIAVVESGEPSAPKRIKIENEFIRFEINEMGEVCNLFDKSTHREISDGPCNVFKMYKDVPGWFDAWDIDSMYIECPVELSTEAVVEVLSSGPLIATVRVTRILNNSRIVQEISLRRGSRRIDFATQIDWQERHKLLKVNFPVNIHANEAIHEIQFGHIRRPNHKSRPFDADRFEVSNHKWTALAEENCGVAILNDCKYGISVCGNSMNLTLLKSAMAPDMMADLGLHEFTYSLYSWNGPFADSPVVQEAYDLNIPAWVVSGAAGEQSIFTVSAPNIVLETVKLAEDGDDIVVRLYESKRMTTRCVLSTSLPIQRAALTNMLEEIQGDVLIENGRIELDFRPFEIKTLRLFLAR